jgi:hypothetical protein
MQYRLTAENYVWIVGTINAAAGGAIPGGTLGTLAAGYRPNAPCGVPISVYGASGISNFFITINTNGNISIPAVVGATAMVFNGAFPLGIS